MRCVCKNTGAWTEEDVLLTSWHWGRSASSGFMTYPWKSKHVINQSRNAKIIKTILYNREVRVCCGWVGDILDQTVLRTYIRILNGANNSGPMFICKLRKTYCINWKTERFLIVDRLGQLVVSVISMPSSILWLW